MILPTTYLAALLLSIVSMVCLGSWVNTQKMAGKWRFELYYYDFSLGLVISALIAAFTLGSLRSSDLTFSDNFLIVSRHQMAYAAGAGALFNLANLLLLAAVSVSGMAVAFPIALGLALIVELVWGYLTNPQGDALLLFGGALLVLIGIVVLCVAYSTFLTAQREAQVKALNPDPRAKAIRKQQPGAARAIFLAVVAGVFFSLYQPVVDLARAGEDGVAPYGMGVLMSVGVLLTSLLYIPFFLNFPVEGEPISVGAFFKGTLSRHAMGWLGGFLWLAGALCGFLAYATPGKEQLAQPLSYALTKGVPIVALLWGLFVWREFKGAHERVRLLLIVTVVLLLSGIAMIAMAPLRGK